MRRILGFTVIEVVFCIIIFSILAAISIPRLFSKKSYDERFFVDQMLATVRYAQKMAIATGCRMQVNLQNGSLIIQRAASCTSGAFNITVTDPFTGVPYTKPMPADISVDASQFPIYFNSIGRAFNSATNTVNSAYTITVDTTTITIVGETGYAYSS
jgi:MSHA pilin protein MshC